MPTRIPGKASRPYGGTSIPIGIHEIADLLDVKRATVDQWRSRGILPPPEGQISGNPWWWENLILKWAKSTGRL